MSRKNYRSDKYAKIGGVCSGIALSNGYSISLVRIIALLIFAIAGIGIVAYLLIWAFLPSASSESVLEPETLPADPLLRSSKDSVLGGVCGGLAELLKVDANLIRVTYVLLVLIAGLGIIPYIYAWFILPKNPTA